MPRGSGNGGGAGSGHAAGAQGPGGLRQSRSGGHDVVHDDDEASWRTGALHRPADIALTLLRIEPRLVPRPPTQAQAVIDHRDDTTCSQGARGAEYDATPCILPAPTASHRPRRDGDEDHRVGGAG